MFIDGTQAHGSNISEGAAGETLTIEDVRIHLLNAGRRFDMLNRRPAD